MLLGGIRVWVAGWVVAVGRCYGMQVGTGWVSAMGRYYRADLCKCFSFSVAVIEQSLNKWS